MNGDPRCKACVHPERTSIDADLAGGETNIAVAARYGLSKDSIRRHKDKHLSESLKAVQARREAEGATTAIDRMERLYDKAQGILTLAEAQGKAALSLAALKELRGIVELLAKLSGELDERPTVQVLNVQASPEWAVLRGVILAALRPFPEASQAVAGALEQGGER